MEIAPTFSSLWFFSQLENYIFDLCGIDRNKIRILKSDSRAPTVASETADEFDKLMSVG